MQNLTQKLYKESIKDIKTKFLHNNDLAVPRLKMVSLNIGIKADDADSKLLLSLVSQLSTLSGQKAVLTKSRKSIASFRLRKNIPVGCMVTLRRKNMYNFLDKLINISLPRVRDFRGLSSKGFNQSFHYSFGIRDNSIFLESDTENSLKALGLNINIVTTAKTREEALYLLKKLNLPIK